MKVIRPRARQAVLVCLILSGAAGLSYEVLWTRILTLSFGHTIHAVTTVLAVFMCGLALGSRLFGALADRVRRPLLLYGALELGIGLYCLAAPRLLEAARGLYLAVYPSLGSAATRVAVQFVLSVMVLVVPTTLMGGTLPAAVKGLAEGMTSNRRLTALVYGLNTLGAAAGAFAAGYWSLHVLGAARTNLAGVALNLLAGAATAVLAVRSFPARTPPPQAAGVQEDVARGGRTDPMTRAILWGIAISGAASLSYQILWTRALVLVIGSSTYAFSCILVTFLAGLALGSLLFSFFRERTEPARTFAFLQVLIGAGAMLLVPFFQALPSLYVELFSGYRGHYGFIMLLQFLLAGAVVFVPALFMGMTVPCAIALTARKEDFLGRDVGKVLAWNTWGSVFGSTMTGLAVVSLLGVQRALVLCIGANLLAALLVLVAVEPRRLRSLLPAWFAAVATLLVLPSWSRHAMVSGPSDYPDLYYMQDDLLGERPRHETWELLFFEEGVGSTVAVIRTPDGIRSLRVNGRAEASTTPIDIETFIKLAYIPMVLHPEPRRVGMVGLGAGISALTVAKFDTPKRIDITELDPSVVRAQAVFSPGDWNALADSRVRLVVDDGRTALEASREPYDVVICGPSHTWAAGVANLFTREFLQAVRGRLSTGGVFCQWINGSYLDAPDLRLILKTFLSVFPDATLWEGYNSDLFLVGCNGEFPAVPWASLRAKVESHPRLAEFLRLQGDPPTEAVLASYRLSASGMSSLAGPGRVNTDDSNTLEFTAPRGLYRMFTGDEPLAIAEDRRLTFPPFLETEGPVDRATLLSTSLYLIERNRPAQARRILETISSLWSASTDKSSGAPWRGLLGSGQGILEGFEEDTATPLYPLVAGYRPVGVQKSETQLWDAYREYFIKISGLAPGKGRDGSTALAIHAMPTPMPLAFLAPLEVEPGARYEVSFWMRSDSGADVEAGAGYMEYRTALPFDDAFTLAVHEQNRVGGKKAVSVMGSSPWRRLSFELPVSLNTRLVHLQLFRIGPPSLGDVYFDDLSIRRLG